MNDTDTAQEVELRGREISVLAVTARRRIQPITRKTADGGTEYLCAERDCGEVLEPHRVEHGRCYECARAAEIKSKQHHPRS